MNSVFILQHSYESGDCDETQFIGVYSSRLEAESAIKRLSVKNGFKYRVDGFVISEYEINKDHWSEGFSTITAIQVKAINGEWITVEAKCLPNEEYMIIEKYENDKLGEFKDGDIVKCKEDAGELYAFEKITKREGAK